MGLEDTLLQIEDKLSDLVIGPVLGTVIATASAGSKVEIPQGQMGTLPDGRRIRVRYGRDVTPIATPIPVRLDILTPAFPAKNNFAPVTDATIVTWTNPPAKIAPTGVVSGAFGKNAGTLGEDGKPLACLSSVGRIERFEDLADNFLAGAQGSAHAVIGCAPEVRIWNNSGTALSGIQPFEVTWRIRFYVVPFTIERPIGVTARHLFAAVCAVLQGSTCGDDPVRISGWKMVPGKQDKRAVYELAIQTHLWSEGRRMQDFAIADHDGHGFEEFDLSVRIPGDDQDQTPFRVDDLIDVPT